MRSVGNRKLGLAVVCAATLMGMSAAPAAADLIWDVEAARANARAGGPISAYDAELLERWGCLSGTKSAFCRKIRHGATTANDGERRRGVRR